MGGQTWEENGEGQGVRAVRSIHVRDIDCCRRVMEGKMAGRFCEGQGGSAVRCIQVREGDCCRRMMGGKRGRGAITGKGSAGCRMSSGSTHMSDLLSAGCPHFCVSTLVCLHTCAPPPPHLCAGVLEAVGAAADARPGLGCEREGPPAPRMHALPGCGPPTGKCGKVWGCVGMECGGLRAGERGELGNASF